MKAQPKIALIHDWLNGMRGGERVLQNLCEMYPTAKIFTLLLEREKISETILKHKIGTSFIQRLPFRKTKYRNYLPLFPRAIESFDLEGFDLVISTSHCVAKGAIPSKNAIHICYCFSPVRYVWQFYEDYFGRNPVRKLFLKPVLERIRKWDLATCSRVNEFVAISQNIAERIKLFYNRDAKIIYPPVDTDFYCMSDSSREDYYLIVSALVPYKQIGLAIRAFNILGRKLRIVGDGPEMKNLRRIAGSTIEFTGWLSDEEVREHYRKCRAFVFPGEEDFGLTPIEANACGAPVIAYGKGGVLESITDGENGMFFSDQTEESLIESVKEFEKKEFNPGICREKSLRFYTSVFRKTFGYYVDSQLSNL